MSFLDDYHKHLSRILQSLPPNPIAPENRGLACLKPSGYVPRGQVYRIVPPDPIGDIRRPVILLHPDDLTELRQNCGPLMDDQTIADVCEQAFAEQEARSTR